MLAPLVAILVGVCIICSVIVFIESGSIDRNHRPHVIDAVREAHEESREKWTTRPTASSVHVAVDLNNEHKHRDANGDV